MTEEETDQFAQYLNLEELPNGCVLKYRNKYYFLSKGVEGRIVTDQEGHWKFLRELTWVTYQVVFIPKGY